MKFILVALILTIVFGLILSLPLYGKLEIQVLNSLFSNQVDQPRKMPPANTPLGGSKNNATSSKTQKFTPQGFKGPSGDPGVRGPSSPPPNY